MIPRQHPASYYFNALAGLLKSRQGSPSSPPASPKMTGSPRESSPSTLKPRAKQGGVREMRDVSSAEIKLAIESLRVAVGAAN